MREELQQCLEDLSHRNSEVRCLAELAVEELAGLEGSISGSDESPATASVTVTPADRLQLSECVVERSVVGTCSPNRVSVARWMSRPNGGEFGSRVGMRRGTFCFSER